MFRLKLSAVLAVSLAVGAFGASQLVGGSVDDVEERLRADVERTHLAYERIKRLRDLQLKDFAAALASSELGAYLGVLSDHRRRMLEVEADVYREVPGPANDTELQELRRAFVVGHRGAFLDEFAGDLAARVERARGPDAWADKPRAEFVAEVRESLAVCNSFGVNNCVYRFTYVPLEALARAERDSEVHGVRPDKIIVVDHRGAGVADADRSNWSDETRFGSEHPVTLEVKSGAILRDIIKLRDDYYFTSVAPVFEQGRFRGSVLVGVAIDGELLGEEGEVLGRMVGYLHGKEVFRSAFDDRVAAEIRHNVPTDASPPRYTTVETERVLAQFVPLYGNATNNRIRVVLAIDKEAALSSLRESRMWIWLGAALLLVLGLLAMARFYYVFSRPFVKLDAGIHEVNNGNRDYVFPDGFKEPMWASLGSNLNVLVANLTGRELPAVNDTWAADLLAEQSGERPMPPAAGGDAAPAEASPADGTDARP